ncbi:NAD(P)-binding protein [Desulfovibrio sp. OttesenSCG-928-G11]|nr:NAD(P)-binding protein [Desulfovibrio sp. OttesenSCG-928-G11]
MDQSQLRDFEGRCIQEEAPACQTMCPLHVEARAFCARMAGGALAEARKILDRAMPLSGLVARLCHGACLPHCRRAELDGAVNMPLLELACVQQTPSVRPMAMPATGKTVAVAGAGLSSLALAFELAKKGHGVTIFHKGPPGGRLASLTPDILPPEVLAGALEDLAAMRVRFEELPAFSPAWREAVLQSCQALYAGLDDPQLTLAGLGLDGISDYLTLETNCDPRLFAGGQRGGSPSFAPSGPSPEPSFVREAADGKRAAGSIVRLLQGVAPSSARDREDAFQALAVKAAPGLGNGLVKRRRGRVGGLHRRQRGRAGNICKKQAGVYVFPISGRIQGLSQALCKGNLQ